MSPQADARSNRLGNNRPDSDVPGGDMPGSDMPGSDVPGSDVPNGGMPETGTRRMRDCSGYLDPIDAEIPEGPPPRGHDRSGSRAGRWWVIGAIVLVVWSLWSTGIGREPVLNPPGLQTLRSFWEAALRPDLSAEYLRRTLDATLITVTFALLGTVLASLIGLVGGVLMSEAWWAGGRRGRPARGGARQSVRNGARRPGWMLTRIGLGIPRGIHEAVWGIILLVILGRDPLVGILALTIPFGAITAKVYAEIIDETPSGPYDALIHAGAGRLQAFVYATLPRIWDDLLAYAFYRFDCAVRSAVILGMIGAGGLGFELITAFQGLAYERMWTLIYALVLLGWVFDRWSASLRHTGRGRWMRISALLGLALTVWSVVYLRPDLGRLVSASTWERAGRMAADALPPSLPSTWADLLGDAAATVQMSVLAVVVGSAIGVVAAFLGVHRPGDGPVRAAVAGACRIILLTIRALSPPVWALLLLFVVLPGPLPGALALGLYNAGVLGRLFTEVLETMDRRPVLSLQLLGAGRIATFVYGVLPLVAGRFTAYALYRWEIAIRETVVVGVVGAGGLGRVLESQRASFDYSGMLTVVIALLLLSLLVDLASASARRAWR